MRQPDRAPLGRAGRTPPAAAPRSPTASARAPRPTARVCGTAGCLRRAARQLCSARTLRMGGSPSAIADVGARGAARRARALGCTALAARLHVGGTPRQQAWLARVKLGASGGPARATRKPVSAPAMWRRRARRPACAPRWLRTRAWRSRAAMAPVPRRLACSPRSSGLFAAIVRRTTTGHQGASQQSLAKGSRERPNRSSERRGHAAQGGEELGGGEGGGAMPPAQLDRAGERQPSVRCRAGHASGEPARRADARARVRPRGRRAASSTWTIRWAR